jgi:hypothetical protein
MGIGAESVNLNIILPLDCLLDTDQRIEARLHHVTTAL